MAKIATAESKPTGVKMASVAQAKKTDQPEYIKPEELAGHFPFTIFYAAKGGKSRFQRDVTRLRFSVAFKIGETVEKRVLVLNENEERIDLMYQVARHKAVTNCRIVSIDIGNGMNYWKIVDASDPLPELAEVTDPAIDDNDIPF